MPSGIGDEGWVMFEEGSQMQKVHSNCCNVKLENLVGSLRFEFDL